MFPGLAVAEQLVARRPQVRITFVGSGKQFERRHVAAAGFGYVALPCRPLPTRPRELFSFLAINLSGYRAARRFLRCRDVDAVIGLGGYASVPLARAAGRCGLPLVLLEQNAVPGRATRWLAHWAILVCTALAPTRADLRGRCPVRVTGNPIRPGFDEVPFASSPQRRLLILGGSGGARSLNENLPKALYKIRAELDGWQIVHQTGESDLQITGELYRKLGLAATVVTFMADLPQRLAATDLAVCRAGGTTLSELAAAGVPAVLLPYPHAADDHQRHNAEVFTAAGGSVTLDQRELPGRLGDHLAAALKELFNDPEQRARMSAAMRRLARPHAAAEVADLILEVVGKPSRRDKTSLAA